MGNAIQDQIISFKSKGQHSLPIKNLMVYLQRQGYNIDYDSLSEYLRTTEYSIENDNINLVNDNIDDNENDKIDKSLVKTARKGLKNDML